MSKHNSTTLHYKRRHENADPAWGIHDIFTPHSALVASTNNEEDARHIVRCVNNFDALVEALEAVLKARASVDPEGLFDGLEIIQARAALSAARGEG